jgi:P4 family phage/plasmid primase-like protien
VSPELRRGGLRVRLNQVVIEAALAYVKAGFSVIPIKADGSKRPPPLSWKPWQSRRPSPYEIGQIFRGDLGIAVLGGKVSGGLEILDFDRAEFIDPWILKVEEKTPGLVARLPRIRTPKGGAHFYYRSKKIEGNQKLAQEPPSVDESGNPKPNTLIETRGEGGYVLAPPSPAACHPRNVPYEHVAGPPVLETPEITPDERGWLLEAARGFNTWVPAITDHGGGGKTDPGDRTLPGNDFNDRARWSEILEPAGWKMLGIRGDVVQWSRPGKTDGGMSATTGHCGDNLWVFSSNAQPFESSQGYTKFAAYCLIHHSGDYSQAAKALEKMGYGNREAAEREVEEFEQIVSEPEKPKELVPFTPQADYKKKKEERKSSPEKYFDGRTFLPELLSREICGKYRLIATPIGDDGFGTRVHVYRDGAFRPGGESVVVDEAYMLLGERANDNRITDVVKNVRISNKVDYKNLNTAAKNLINVKNGMLDWKTGTLSQHDPKYMSTIQIDTDYEPDVHSEKIDKFLEMVLAPDEIPVMEEFLGYLLIPETAFNKCLVVIGEGGNGKSTIMDLMMGFLGEDNISHYSLQHISEEKFSVAGLFGSLANFYDELQTKQIHDTATFKIITGGSPLKAEDKGKAPFSFRPFCRLVFSANEMPRADDRSQAYFDRFIFVKLPNRIRGTRAEILGYANVLLAMPGVKATLLNRAITGLRRLMKQVRFSSSASSMEAIEDYRRECNSAYDFVKEYCTFEDPTGWVSKQDLYDRYKIWCNESTRKAMSSRGFARGLETMNVRVVRHGEARGWGGIAWTNGTAPRTREDEVREFGSQSEQKDSGEQAHLNF